MRRFCLITACGIIFALIARAVEIDPSPIVILLGVVIFGGFLFAAALKH